MPATSYLVGLGCNRRHGRHGPPERVIAAALAAIAAAGIVVEAATTPRPSAALGPAGRRFANAAARVRTALGPPALLATLKAIERDFGRRRGRRWGARVLDLDILAWEGGAWPPRPAPRDRWLTVPHAQLAQRRFALDPAAALAPGWRIDGLTLRHAVARLAKARPVDRRATPA